jgi:hypothetical protein
LPKPSYCLPRKSMAAKLLVQNAKRHSQECRMSTGTVKAFMRTMCSPARVVIKHIIGGTICDDTSGLGVYVRSEWVWPSLFPHFYFLCSHVDPNFVIGKRRTNYRMALALYRTRAA